MIVTYHISHSQYSHKTPPLVKQWRHSDWPPFLLHLSEWVGRVKMTARANPATPLSKTSVFLGASSFGTCGSGANAGSVWKKYGYRDRSASALAQTPPFPINTLQTHPAAYIFSLAVRAYTIPVSWRLAAFGSSGPRSRLREKKPPSDFQNNNKDETEGERIGASACRFSPPKTFKAVC